MAADGDKNGDIPEEIKLHGARDGGADRFVYTYTAPTAEERREIEGIRSRYFPRSSAESRLEYVRKLDKRVRSLPNALAVTLGVVGILVFGGGLALCLEGAFAGAVAAGAVIAAFGAVLMACAKPVHSVLFKRMKAKYGDTIVKLTSELLGEREDGSE